MNKLIYIADPMCSWCYGFSPEIRKVKEHFSEFAFTLIMGGLRPYNTERIVVMQDFLREHWEQVNERSGQPFNFGILHDQNFIYDTEPPARATVVMRSLSPQHELEFFSAVQTAFYLKNRDTSKVETYHDVITDLGLPVDLIEFSQLFESEEMKVKIKDDFTYAGQLGIRGFPSLVSSEQDRFSMVSRGYEKADSIIQRIELLAIE